MDDLSSQELINIGWGGYSKYVPTDYDHFRNDAEFSVLLDNSIRWRMMKIYRYRRTKTQTLNAIDLIEENIKARINLSPIRNLTHLIDTDKGINPIIDIINIGDTNDQGYDISESAINDLGYELVTQDRKNDALRIFKLNTEIYPDSFKTYDSYGEILLITEDKENAIKAYEKSLKLNPDNENAKKVLLEIK